MPEIRQSKITAFVSEFKLLAGWLWVLHRTRILCVRGCGYFTGLLSCVYVGVGTSQDSYLQNVTPKFKMSELIKSQVSVTVNQSGVLLLNSLYITVIKSNTEQLCRTQY